MPTGEETMLSSDLLCTVQQLSVKDKLLLIEVVTSLLRDDLTADKYGDSAQQNGSQYASLSTPDESETNAAFLIAQLLNRPNPTAEQMLPRGLFKGELNLSDEDFKIAEWHPSEKDLLGD